MKIDSAARGNQPFRTGNVQEILVNGACIYFDLSHRIYPRWGSRWVGRCKEIYGLPRSLVMVISNGGAGNGIGIGSNACIACVQANMVTLHVARSNNAYMASVRAISLHVANANAYNARVQTSSTMSGRTYCMSPVASSIMTVSEMVMRAMPPSDATAPAQHSAYQS